MRNIRFRYAPDAPDVLRDVSLIVRKQEIFCLLGGNASGKTTLLTAAARLLKPQSGTVFVFGKKLKAYHSTELYRNCLSMLPQDVQTIFLKDTVREEWDGVTDFPFLSASLLDQHPYDLSGGEQQMAALGKVLRQKPRLLLLDEPSKGMDADAKCRLAQLLKQWRKDGVTILFTTHDIDFAGECADRCALMFRGQIVSDAQTPDFTEMHRFYTTAANRMTRGIYKNVVTVEEAAALCQKNGRFPSEKDAEPICSDDPNGR